VHDSLHRPSVVCLHLSSSVACTLRLAPLLVGRYQNRMLTIANLHRAFGGQKVFAGANWFVPERGRVGLVGANGSGKSTLLRLVVGLDQPDEGTISVPKGTTVGYLPQEVLGISGRTVLAEAMDAFAGVLALEQECRELEDALGRCDPEGPQYADLMDSYTRARARWDHEGGYDHESQARAVLAGLGFRESDFTRDTGEFSGGWQMRIVLAKLLLQRPSLLLLDEPTNHLDLEARNWLETFLAGYPGTVIVVAHDHYFLDVTVNRITEVSRGGLTDYHTTYSRYIEEKQERQRREREAYEEQQREIERIESFISRFRYQASKAALVQSRIKQLERIDRLPTPDGADRSIHFRFPPCERSGRIVLELHGAVKRYGDLTVYDGLDLSIERGRRVALVGPNGAGKSTLIRLLAGIEPLTAGERQLGYRVSAGYFAQDQTQILDSEKSVLEEITAAAPYDMVPQVRQILGAFLFGGDSVYKRIEVLSGGERNRLALAKLLLQPWNCLLLDEPTNHLDIAAKEVLLEALQHYRGTLVLVAHDRYILDHLPDEIIEVGAGQAVRYIGNYEDYLRQKERQELSAVPAAAVGGRRPETTTLDAIGSAPATSAPTREESVRQREAAKRRAAAALKRKRDMERIENEIAGREAELATVTALINEPDFYTAHANPQEVFSHYAQIKQEIDGLYAKLERMERKQEEEGEAGIQNSEFRIQNS
jgi:ATP-binding cassette, subfamily F, member 3